MTTTTADADEALKQSSEFSFNDEVEDQILRADDQDDANSSSLGVTLLMRAANAADDRGLSSVAHLLKVGADATLIDNSGRSALHYAVLSNSVKVLLLLLRHCPAIVDFQTDCGETPLMCAAALNQARIVMLLLDAGADLTKVNARGQTAGDRAKLFESWSAYMLICRRSSGTKSVKPEEAAEMKKMEKAARALCESAERCDLPSVKNLATSANCNSRWRSRTPLMWAAASGRVGSEKCAAHLLQLGADAALADWEGWTVAHYAAWRDAFSWLPLLPAADLDAKDDNCWTPLIVAAHHNSEAFVQKILECDVDIGARDSNGRSAMVHAKMAKHRRVLKLLMKADKAKNAKPKNLRWSLVDAKPAATAAQLKKTARKLCSLALFGHASELQKVATAENCDTRWRGQTALMYAAGAHCAGSAACCALLIELGADARLRDRRGSTAAHKAAVAGNAAVMKILPRPCTDSKDGDGWTPLMLAADAGNVETVETLLELGVNVNQVNECGSSALSRARRRGFEEIANILLSASKSLRGKCSGEKSEDSMQ